MIDIVCYSLLSTDVVVKCHADARRALGDSYVSYIIMTCCTMASKEYKRRHSPALIQNAIYKTSEDAHPKNITNTATAAPIIAPWRSWEGMRV